MTLLAALVDVGRLGRVVAASFAAGVGITAVFSLGLLGAVRFAEARRRGRSQAAAAFAALAVAGTAVTCAAVGFGIAVMTQK